MNVKKNMHKQLPALDFIMHWLIHINSFLVVHESSLQNHYLYI